MKLQYDEIIKSTSTEGLTLRKITNKYVRETFKREIADLRLVMTMGDGNTGNDLPLKSEPFKPEIINETHVNFQTLLMGQEMPLEIWLSFVRNNLPGKFVKAIQTQQGIFLHSYDKTTEVEHFLAQVEDIPEKEIIEGIKLALKDKFKQDQS